MGMSVSRPSQWLYLTGSCHEVGHTWNPSCIYCSCEILLFVFLGAIKIYLPLYLLSNVRRLGDLRWVLLSLLPNVLRSAVFLSINGGGFVAFLCAVRRLFGRFYFYSSAFLPAFLASLCAIMVERKSRRALLAGYVSCLSIEIVHSVLKSKGLIKSLPFGEVLIFSLASAVLLHRQGTNRSSSQDGVGSLLSGLFRPPVECPINICNPIVTNLVWGGAWGFFCGYLVQSLLSLLSYWKKIKNKTASIKDWLGNKRSVKFGLFLASFVTWFKLSNWLMILFAVPRNLRMIISGLIAGLSMIFVRSSALSLYAGWKAMEIVYFMAVKKGYVKSWYYGDALLYAFSTAVVFHSVFFEGHHVREAYWKFMIDVTRSRLLHIQFPTVDHFGTNSSIRPNQFIQKLSSSSD
ncbi:transmembrane protein 135-like [Halichondria panicea]|uniref:transmembrane protein 135-like n=1 Tax=Halichondria panicea TaxID=6063 RepID=UPI00312B5E72